MQVLDRTGVGTLWSICKTKFALAGHTHTLSQITNAGAAASKNIRTLGSVSHSSWENKDRDDLYVPTMSFIAYWNGAYNSSGNSNLQYCSRGKFGALAVKDTADWSQVANKPATATRFPSWGEVAGKPGSFTPSSHTHDWSQVTGKPELKSWSDTKAYIDSKFSLASGVKRIINIDFISTRAPELIYDHTDINFRLCDAIRDWDGGAIFCTVYNKKIYYGFPYRYNRDSDNPQWITNAFSDKSYATIDPRGEFYHGVVDSDTILNLHGTFYNADLQQCDSNGNVLA